MKFDLPKENASIIKVFGVGGGGGNAVNHMYGLGIKGVDFVVCNTDNQALDTSPVPVKIQLGTSLTEGRGAGSIPEIGKNAAIENIDEIREILEKNTKMVFVTAGMGGGTGTGAAPVIAKIAKDMGILTVGIVTVPFTFEGRKRKQQAELGLDEMRANVDTLLVINNDKLREMYGNLSLKNAFSHADDVLSTAAKGIAEVISITGIINVDFNDVNTVMKDSGVAIMGQATSEGDDRAIKAVQSALSSPLLNDNDISGAKYVLLNISYGSREVLMDEISDITDYIQDEAGSTADVIWGHSEDEALGEALSVTIIATGFNAAPDTGIQKEPEINKVSLTEDRPTMITQPVNSPTQNRIVERREVPSQEQEIFVKRVEPTQPVQETPQNWAPTENVAPRQEGITPPVNEVRPTNEVTPTWEPTNEVQEETTWRQEDPSLNFEVKSPFENRVEETPVSETPTNDNVKRYSLEDDYGMENTANANPAPINQTPSWGSTPQNETWQAPVQRTQDTINRVSLEEQQQLANERIARIKELSSKLKTPSGLSDLEAEPAYKRRAVNLDDVPHSSDNTVSRFTISEETTEDGEKKTGLRGNNSFLHDNVD